MEDVHSTRTSWVIHTISFIQDFSCGNSVINLPTPIEVGLTKSRYSEPFNSFSVADTWQLTTEGNGPMNERATIAERNKLVMLYF